MKPHVLVLALALAAGCVRVPDAAPEEALETTSVPTPDGVTGIVRLATGFTLLDVRLGAAPHDEPPRGTPHAPHVLGSPQAAQTALARDHWVLRVSLAETAAGSARGLLVAQLEWNGVAQTPITLHAAEGAGLPRGLELVYDVGERIETQNQYVLALRAATP